MARMEHVGVNFRKINSLVHTNKLTKILLTGFFLLLFFSVSDINILTSTLGSSEQHAFVFAKTVMFPRIKKGKAIPVTGRGGLQG
jgi:hypothetical protein